MAFFDGIDLCQFAEMERLHLLTLQQLEKELSEARNKTGNNKINVEETSHFVNSGSGNQLDASIRGNSPNGDSRGVQNGDAEIVSSQV